MGERLINECPFIWNDRVRTHDVPGQCSSVFHIVQVVGFQH